MTRSWFLVSYILYLFTSYKIIMISTHYIYLYGFYCRFKSRFCFLIVWKLYYFKSTALYGFCVVILSIISYMYMYLFTVSILLIMKLIIYDQYTYIYWYSFYYHLSLYSASSLMWKLYYFKSTALYGFCVVILSIISYMYMYLFTVSILLIMKLIIYDQYTYIYWYGFYYHLSLYSVSSLMWKVETLNTIITLHIHHALWSQQHYSIISYVHMYMYLYL